MALLLDRLREAGAAEQAAALLARDPAAHVSLDDPVGVAVLLDRLREAGADEQAAALLARDPAAHVSLDDPAAVAELLDSLREAGADDQAAALLDRLREADAERAGRRAGPRAPPTSPPTTRAAWPWLLDRLRAVGAHEQAAALARAPPPTSPSTTRAPWPACWTACGRRTRTSRPPRWPSRAAAHVSLDDPGAVARLLDRLREAGAHEQVTALLHRDPAAHVSLDDPGRVARCWTACGGRARTTRSPRCCTVTPPPTSPSTTRTHVASLLDRLRAAGAQEQVSRAGQRAAAHVALDNPDGVAALLDSAAGGGRAGPDRRAAAP